MIVERFLRWSETASADDRVRGVRMLATAFVEERLGEEAAKVARLAFGRLVADPSDRVRRVLAETLGRSRMGPRDVVLALCEDIDAIAATVAAHSPCLTEGDLLRLASTRGSAVVAAVARRSELPAPVMRLIAERGDREACAELLANGSATLDAGHLATLARRFGEDSPIRTGLLFRPQLRPEDRQSLIARHATALGVSSLVRGALGADAAAAVAEAAAGRASAAIARASAEAGNSPGFAQHLVASGRLTAALLFRALFDGNVDFFAAGLVVLGGQSERRVRSVLVEARERPLASLLSGAGLPQGLAPVVRAALVNWKLFAARGATVEEGTPQAAVLARVLAVAGGLGEDAALGEIVALLRGMEAEAARDAVRHRRAAA